MYYDYLFTFGLSTFTRFMFPIHLLASVFLLVGGTPRRTHFVLRLVLSLAAITITAYIWPTFNYALHVLTFVIVFAESVAMIYVCYAVNIKNAVFAGAAAYAMQHISDAFGEIFMTPFYGFMKGFWMRYLCERVPIILSYVPMYFLFVRQFRKQHDFVIEHKRLAAVVAIVMLSAFALNLVEIRFRSGAQQGLLIICRIYRMICCSLSLAIQSGMFTISRLERDKEILKQLYGAEKKQWKESKENIDLINIKLHDIKHKLSSVTDGDRYREIAEAVSIYDRIAKTGNDPLDVVITEKNLICEKRGIKLTYIVDGKALGFISPSDIYSLFGNILDNAIECVSDIDSPKRRIVNMRIDAKNGFLRIMCENRCERDLVFKDGLPQTTKTDNPGYHGYGVKSIKYTVEKYNGNVKLSLADNIFRVTAVIPVTPTPTE